jgi:hypothetical protein
LPQACPDELLLVLDALVQLDDRRQFEPLLLLLEDLLPLRPEGLHPLEVLLAGKSIPVRLERVVAVRTVEDLASRAQM